MGGLNGGAGSAGPGRAAVRLAVLQLVVRERVEDVALAAGPLVGGDPVDRRLVQGAAAAVQVRLPEQGLPSAVARALPERIAASKATTSCHSCGDSSRRALHWALPWYGHPRHALFGVSPKPRERSIRRQSERENPLSIRGNRFFM